MRRHGPRVVPVFFAVTPCVTNQPFGPVLPGHHEIVGGHRVSFGQRNGKKSWYPIPIPPGGFGLFQCHNDQKLPKKGLKKFWPFLAQRKWSVLAHYGLFMAIFVLLWFDIINLKNNISEVSLFRLKIIIVWGSFSFFSNSWSSGSVPPNHLKLQRDEEKLKI